MFGARGLRLVPWVYTCIVLAMCYATTGCDAFYVVRMDFVSGGQRGFAVLHLSDIRDMPENPLEGVCVTLQPSWDQSGWYRKTLVSADGGTVLCEYTLGAPPWGGSKLDALSVAFMASKDGMKPVEGNFLLRGFRGPAEAHRQTVLVVMESAAAGDATTNP